MFDSLQYAVDQNLAPVISMSYGNCEQNLGNFVTTMQQVAQQANVQGQTIVAATGDFGAADCDDAPGLPGAQGGLGVDIPRRFALRDGHRWDNLHGRRDRPATYWNAANNGNNGSAIKYISGGGLNDTTQVQQLSSTGGGASVVYPASLTGRRGLEFPTMECAMCRMCHWPRVLITMAIFSAQTLR